MWDYIFTAVCIISIVGNIINMFRMHQLSKLLDKQTKNKG